MADEKHRAPVLLQQLLEQLQRVDVQVVGGFVQHQHIGGQGEQPGQQQAVALATGQGAHRAVGAFGSEQEVAQVAHDMLAGAVDLDPLAAWADGVGQGGVQVQSGAHLVEVGHLQLRAPPNAALGGFGLPQDEPQEAGLARPVGADQADLVAAQDGGRKAPDQPGLVGAVAQADVLKFGHDLAAGRTRVELQPDLPELLTALRTLLPQGLQPRHAGHAAGTARLHAFSDPHLFLRQQFVGAGVGQGLGIQFPLACLFKGRVRTGVAAQHAAVELHDAAGHGVDEGTVVGDEDQRATPVLQQVLQPLDGVQVEVVGGLVEQEHIGLGHQGLCQGHPLAGAA